MEFHEKVKYAREELGISQEELARALNFSFTSVNRWENGRAKPIRIMQAAFEAYCKSCGIEFNSSKETTKDDR